MREVKFRGLDAHGVPRYGLLIKRYLSTDCWIRAFSTDNDQPQNTDYLVDPKTVSRYTGLKDRNGVEIYEGDVYKRFNYIYQVIWSEQESGWRGICIGREKDFGSGYEVTDGTKNHIHFQIECKDGITEIIGNIHQNPELIH